MASSAAKGGPDLKKYLDKKLYFTLNGGRRVEGFLRGYDVYMNVIVDECLEYLSLTEKKEIGQVFIRGNSIIRFEMKFAENKGQDTGS